MASTINGTSTGNGGLITTGDDSGILQLQTNETTAVTIDASQNVGIGTSSPSSFNSNAYKLVIGSGTGNNGATIYAGAANQAGIYFADGTSGAQQYAGQFIYNHADDSFITYVNGTTLATKIDSSGNLLVGTTDASITSGSGIKLKASRDFSIVSGDSTNTTQNMFMYSTGAATYRFYVGWGGTIYATSTTISSISDIRFKENVRDLDAGLSEVMALKPRLYDWKEGKGADIKNARGFIAQEFEQVFPDLIDEWKDPAPEGEEPYKSVRADLIPVLVKAIQEQQALITTLTERLTALEGAQA